MQMMIDLKVSQVFDGGDVIDFGHSDIFADRSAIELLLLANERVNEITLKSELVFENEHKGGNIVKNFFKLIGFSNYETIDLAYPVYTHTH